MTDINTPTSESPTVLADYLTKEQLAEQLGKSPRTLDRWHDARVGPPRTIIGKTILYRVSSVRKWIEDHEQVEPRAASGE